MGAASPTTAAYRSLPGTRLVGVESAACTACGEEEISIPSIEKLDALLAHLVASRPGRLAGSEIRFLRKHLGWSGVDFARFFSVDPATVSRWETGAQQMDLRAEQLLRVSATRLEPIHDYAEYEALLLRADEAPAGPVNVSVRWHDGSWEAAA